MISHRQTNERSAGIDGGLHDPLGARRPICTSASAQSEGLSKIGAMFATLHKQPSHLELGNTPSNTTGESPESHRYGSTTTATFISIPQDKRIIYPVIRPWLRDQRHMSRDTPTASDLDPKRRFDQEAIGEQPWNAIASVYNCGHHTNVVINERAPSTVCACHGSTKKSPA